MVLMHAVSLSGLQCQQRRLLFSHLRIVTYRLLNDRSVSMLSDERNRLLWSSLLHDRGGPGKDLVGLPFTY